MSHPAHSNSGGDPMRHRSPTRARTRRTPPRQALPRLRASILLAAVMLLGTASARAQAPLQTARASLEQTRESQSDIIASLTRLQTDHRQAASMAELIDELTTIHQMQLAVVRGARAMLAQTFGQSGDDLAETDRRAIEQLAVDQRAVHQRWSDWQTAFGHYAAATETSEPLRIVIERIEGSSAARLMEQAAGQVDQNRLSQASQTGREAADELVRLRFALIAVDLGPDERLEQFIRTLRDIADQERRVRSHLAPAAGAGPDWRRARREQSDTAERTRVLTFPEAAVVPGAVAAIQTAHDAMGEADRHLRSRQRDETLTATEAAIRALEHAIEIAETTGDKDIKGPMPDLPRNPKRPDKQGGMPTVGYGESGAGIDMSAIAQLTADIALVAKLRQRQMQLYQETIGRRPGRPVPAGRQRSYAAQLPQLVRRVELYLPSLTPVLESARASMVESAQRLDADDKPGAAPHQEQALDRLTLAETQMREFYRQLLEALERFTAPAVEGAPHGAEGEEEKAKMKALLVLLREIVRVGMMIKDLDTLMAQTQAWEDATGDALDGRAIAAAAARQRELSRTGLDILEKLKPLPGDVTMSLPEAVLEAAQFMQGAADMLDLPDFTRARERQEIAMGFLESAWQTMAQSMSTLSEGGESDEMDKEENRKSSNQSDEGRPAAVTGDARVVDEKPWYWDLPPRAREAVRQSLAEPLPPKYAPAIERYYERLGNRNKGGH